MAWLAQQTKGLAAAVNVDPASAVKPRRPTGELSMYAEPPEGQVAIEEFERVALDRLRGASSWCTYTFAQADRSSSLPNLICWLPETDDGIA